MMREDRCRLTGAGSRLQERLSVRVVMQQLRHAMQRCRA
jgi:hypothetical protein